jgi:hypothetical protein
MNIYFYSDSCTDRLAGAGTCIFRALCLILTLSGLLFLPYSARAEVRDPALKDSLTALQTVDGAEGLDISRVKNSLSTMNYAGKLVFQALCRLPGADRAAVDSFLEIAAGSQLRFANIGLLDRLVSLSEASPADCARLVTLLGDISFMQERTLVALENAVIDDKARLFAIIDRILVLPETGLWAAINLLRHDRLGEEIVLAALGKVATMTEDQQRAAEKYLLAGGLQPSLLIGDLAAIAKLEDSSVANFYSLCANVPTSRETLSNWLNTFFLLSPQQQESKSSLLHGTRHQQLLSTYNGAASSIIWKINNLHAVTDSSGREIGTASLTRMEPEELTALFIRLPEAARTVSTEMFHKSIAERNRPAAIALLREATARARQLAAAELTSANLYVLLANGGEIYTSSFREIVAPALHKRIVREFQGELLRFLRTIDPDGTFVSDFITNLAQKGMLPAFLPANSPEQEKIVDLVADSALADENSLVLFSATFANLLQTFVPKVRDRLVQRLLESIENGSLLFSRQVRVILQFYYYSHPELLSDKTLQLIQKLLSSHGEIDLQSYTATPFAEWRRDGRLVSLSTFAVDDDGWTSYSSFSHYLLKNGYLPVFSERYRFDSSRNDVAHQFSKLTSSVPGNPASAISGLFTLSISHPAVVEWKKSVNGLTVIHGVYVYTNGKNQQRLLEVFLREGDEMFAQRGHSYYRNTQLLDPLGTLLTERKVDDELLGAKTRFISLGSCGGIKVYTQINEIFGSNVDIFGTVGTGTASINNPFNGRLLEVAALDPPPKSWQEVERRLGIVFEGGRANGGYLAPGSLPAILHKMHHRTGSTTLHTDHAMAQ